MKTLYRKFLKQTRPLCALAAALGMALLLTACTETANNSSAPAPTASAQTAQQSEQAAVESGVSGGSSTAAPTASNTASGGAKSTAPSNQTAAAKVTLNTLPAYSGKAYVALNQNKPNFTAAEQTKKSYEKYGSLDSLGRCTTAMACIGKDIMPTEKRGEIGSVKPTGWHLVKYDCVDGKYLYNRCHLIGYQLTGENANRQNLITGTRYLNISGMLPFENMVADYVKETGNHVLYRVKPVFSGKNLLASGVEMEGYSVEDKGAGICFHVYCYNIQPGVKINYADGSSALDGSKTPAAKTSSAKPASSKPASSKASSKVASTKPTGGTTPQSGSYVLNTSTKKFHTPTCGSAKTISEKNRQTYTGNRQYLLDNGYVPCKNCKP